MDDWKDILPGKDEQLTDEDLLKYLHNEMSDEEKYQFEKKISSFESDALDGLQQINDKTRLHNHIKQLNKKLPQLLLLKKQRLEKRKLREMQWTILTIIIVLFLCITTYALIRMNS